MWVRMMVLLLGLSLISGCVVYPVHWGHGWRGRDRHHHHDYRSPGGGGPRHHHRDGRW